MKTIAVIGAVRLQNFLHSNQKLLADNYRIVAVMARNPEHANALAQTLDADACTSIDELLSGFPDIVVEFAGRDAVKEYALPVLEHGSDLIIVSIGALADDEFRHNLTEYAQKITERFISERRHRGA